MSEIENDSNPNESQTDSYCECQHLVALTEADCISTLDIALEQQIGTILPTTRYFCIRKNETLSLVSNAKVKTFFDLSDSNCSIAKIIVESNLDNTTTERVNTLLFVYQNQYRLISRINNDQLTKLGNRLALENKFYDLFHFGQNKRKRKISSACVALFDIDHFKKINDQYGHLYGDEVLVHLSQLMIKTFRDSDFLFRYGGEEFVVILTDLELERAVMVMERFRDKVESYEFPLVGQVTISLGLTQLDRSLDSITTLSRADKALYHAKENGRNQLHTFETLVSNGVLKDDKPAEDDITLFS